MKKSRIFMAAGAFVFAIAGVLATKANKKFTQVTSATASLPAGYAVSGNITLPAAHFTTVTNSNQAYIAIYTISSPTTPTFLAGAPLKSGASNVFVY